VRARHEQEQIHMADEMDWSESKLIRIENAAKD
jgi:hypothetical protein